MSDQLSAADRRLIDEAIARGQITHVNPGVSGHPGYRFDGRRLVAVDGGFNWRATNGQGRKKGHITERGREMRAGVSELHARGWTASEIARKLGCSANTVRFHAKRLGLSFDHRAANGSRRRPEDKANTRARDVAERKIAKLCQEHGREREASAAGPVAVNRRRFVEGPVPTGKYNNVLQGDRDGSIFPKWVRDVDDAEVLKPGQNSVKLGDEVLVGRLKGAAIFSLTLEERATCPKTCEHWRGCYGNNMQRAIRFRHGPDLEARLREEVAEKCAANSHVLIRLHVLGDFYSAEYVTLWAEFLRNHQNLTIFGFTAWSRETEIGAAIAWLRQQKPRRFMIRHSSSKRVWGSFTVDDPFAPKTIRSAIVCPEQRDAVGPRRGVHCGSCGICWSTSRPIAFIKH